MTYSLKYFLIFSAARYFLTKTCAKLYTCFTCLTEKVKVKQNSYRSGVLIVKKLQKKFSGQNC